MTAEITGFECKPLDALRARPDRLTMGIGAGDSLRNHRDLIALHARLFEICNTRGIEYMAVGCATPSIKNSRHFFRYI